MGFACEPRASLGDALLHRASWEDLDAELSRLLGRAALAIPSVRVGLVWILESLGLRRNEDEVLVARYMGRCVVETLERVAHPTYVPTPRTKAAVLAHFFGLEPDWKAVLPELSRRGLAFVEDAPDALAPSESPAPGSLGKLIALWKLLPAVKGACLITDRPEVAAAVRRRRAEPGSRVAAFFVWSAAIALRVFGGENPALADAMYSLYPHAPSGNGALRGGLMKALGRLQDYSDVEGRRLKLLERSLGERVIAPDARRLLHYAAVLTKSGELESPLREAGFSPATFHLDINRNPFSPSFQAVYAVPLHPQIPEDAFSRLLGSPRPVPHVLR